MVFISHFVILGVGIFAVKDFAPGSFLLQYPGDLIIDQKEVERREEKYRKESRGCFMYFFQQKNAAMW